jgi:Reverse transcriptase (RNA-dependent DNA polymerase).
MRAAKVLRRSRNEDGEIVGTHNENPLMNTLVYDVEFPDGEVREYSANILAENMYAQVDADGHTHTMLDSIIDYSKNGNAVSKEDGYVITKRGRKRRRMTTAGWMLNVLWKDGSEQWIPLAIMKESHPLETADFAVSRNINDEPAFAWWTPFILRKRDRVISGMIARVKKVTHKYGVELPTTVQEAFDLDKKNGNTLWRDALTKEMENLKVAFDILERGQAPPPGYKKASGHIIFDVRMTLERKARWVKDGHKTPQPDNCTYAGVVSRESVRIALTSAALNGLPVCACDIQNAYLQAPSSEKHYIKCGREFGIENEGKLAVIVRALYGGKSAGADYWRHVRSAMTHMNFKPCTADPDVWIRPGVKADGLTYWQYVLLYTDDILAIMEEPEKFIREELGHYFKVKENSIGPPTQYLGNKVSQVTMENGVKCWSFSSSQYVQNAIKNVEDYLAKSDSKLPARAKSPWTSNYRPEIDITPELIPVKAAYYQSLIGVLRWIVELGRGDICMEVSAMASMMALPREGHLDQLFHMFAFLKTNHNGVMVFDPTEPDIDSSCFVREDWSAAAYGECEEELPPNMPEPRGVQMTMRAFVDSDHAGDTTTRRSRTGFIIFLNNAPIYWFSKKQTSVETSSFGSEFIAMKQCCEYIRGLRYKLRMMGIPVGSPTFVFGDNQSVLANTTRPHSILRKKSASIAYHFVREGVAKDEWRTTYLNTHLNPSDLMTKSLPGGEKRTRFTAYFLHYLG